MKLSKKQALGIVASTATSAYVASTATTTVLASTAVAGAISSKAVIVNGSTAYLSVVPMSIAGKIILGSVLTIVGGILVYNLLKNKKK